MCDLCSIFGLEEFPESEIKTDAVVTEQNVYVAYKSSHSSPLVCVLYNLHVVLSPKVAYESDQDTENT